MDYNILSIEIERMGQGKQIIFSVKGKYQIKS